MICKVKFLLREVFNFFIFFDLKGCFMFFFLDFILILVNLKMFGNGIFLGFIFMKVFLGRDMVKRWKLFIIYFKWFRNRGLIMFLCLDLKLINFFFFFFSWCEVIRKCRSVFNEYFDDYIFFYKYCVCFFVFFDRFRVVGDSVFFVEYSVYF